MNKLILPATAGMLAFMATGCIDSNYDLSDIDTTVKVGVDHLVVPINIDEISMESIIDLKDDNIKVIDGAYTYIKDGDFSSGKISVDPVTVKIKPISQVGFGFNLPPVPGSIGAMDLPLNLEPGDVAITSYDFNSSSISNDIYGLSHISGTFDANVKIAFEGAGSALSSIDLNDFKLQLPSNLNIIPAEGQTYDPATGVLGVSRAGCPMQFNIPIKANGLDIAAEAFDPATHSLSICGKAGIIGGGLVLHTAAGGSVPSSMRITADISFASDISINSIDGKIGYSIDNVDIPDINLDNLPDVIAQPGTNLILADPRLYVSFNNPLASTGLYATSGFTITAYHGEQARTYEIDNKTFRINASENNNFCFSPKAPAADNADFPSATHVPYTQLSYVLSGDGVPQRLHVELPDPQIPVQAVTGFMLGHDYGDVHGRYSFNAPLQFSDGTCITYEHTVDGWSEDLEDLVVTALEVNVEVSTDIPVEASFVAYPLDAKGDRIAGVTIESTKINANAAAQAVTVKVSGTIRGLDGIELVATANATDGKALSPSMYVRLSKIRPCVSGYYTKEL